MGGVEAVLWGAIGFGLLMLALYTLLDTLHAVRDAVSSPKAVYQTLNVERLEVPSRRGTDVTGDPTRPRTDDFAGMIEYGKHRT